MSRFALICQGFQRGFVDTTSPIFSVSASLRRSVCEQILKHARRRGWPVIHIYLEGALSLSEAAALEGFSPGPLESYFCQRTLSAFACPGLEERLRSFNCEGVFLISYAGLAAIAGTFLEALQRRIPIRLVTDAIADTALSGVAEEERLNALSVLARSCGRDVCSFDLLSAQFDVQSSAQADWRSAPAVLLQDVFAQ